MSHEEVREEVRKYVNSGIDFVNYAVTVHRLNALQYLVFSPRVQRAIVEEAHLAGLPVSAFYPHTNEAVVLALTSEVDLLHVGLVDMDISAETVAMITQRQIPCALFLHACKALEWARQRALMDLEKLDRNNRVLIDAGATVLPKGGQVYSADTMNSSEWKDSIPPEGTPLISDSHFNWLLAMQDKGVKPMVGLMGATRNIARAYKVDKDLGTLERGKLADLVVLDKNPLERAENYRSISLVMKEGKLVDRGALPTQRLITTPSVEAN